MVSSIAFQEPERPTRRKRRSRDKFEEDVSLGQTPADPAYEETSTAPPSKVKPCKTIPNWENEFHRAIHSHDWDELEHLLKEYDLKKYTGPKKKPKRKLRVAKYLPDLPWKKEEEDEGPPQNPLYGADELGRTPLHLCCINPVPSKLLIRLLFVARNVTTVPDKTGSLPLHLAVIYERNVDIIDRLIRGFFQASWTADISGNTPLMWAIEIVQRLQQEENKAVSGTFWGFPARPVDQEWQQRQEHLWKTVEFLLEDRHMRRQKLVPEEYGQVKRVFGLAAPPRVAELIMITGQKALKREAVVAPSIFLCIRRQYPLNILQQLIESSPRGLLKVQKDSSGRGMVAVHYKVGCVVHKTLGQNRQSFRMIMEKLANRGNSAKEEFSPPPSYLDWWEKLKFLIGLWGSHADKFGEYSEDSDSEGEIDEANLLLHRALSNPDCPPSLIHLLAALNPPATKVAQPVSGALPIHLACRVWRYRHYPPRPDEKEMSMEKVLPKLLGRDLERSRMRYHDRLPLHHAIAAGKNWTFLTPMVIPDINSLLVRDPMTRLYPFQLAASYPKVPMDSTKLALRTFAYKDWNNLKDYQKDQELQSIDFFYDLEQLTVIFEALRHCPTAINHDALVRIKPQMRNPIVLEDVVSITLMKTVRATFGVGNVAAHFISWGYENTEKGWKTHRRNFAVIKTGIMDGFIPTAMDKWWRKLKFWIWNDCPWKHIPRKDEFLLHGAVCNPDVSPWIVALLVECFPRSTSIPLPNSGGCYPLHIACATDRYISLPWEFPNKRTSVELVARMHPDAIMMKWKQRLPLHLAISNSKDYEEIKYMVDSESLLLAMRDPISRLFPFQLMAVDRSFTPKQKQRFETKARKAVGAAEWKLTSAQEKVICLSKVLQDHETEMLQGIWELLRRNADFVSSDVKETGMGSDSRVSMNSSEMKPVRMGTTSDLSTQMSLRQDSGMVTTPSQTTKTSPDFGDPETRNSCGLAGSKESSREASLRIGDLIFDENKGSKKPIKSANFSMASLSFLEETYGKESARNRTWRTVEVGDTLDNIAELSASRCIVEDEFRPVKALEIEDNVRSLEGYVSDLEEDDDPENSPANVAGIVNVRDSNPPTFDGAPPVLNSSDGNGKFGTKGDGFKPVEAVELGHPMADAEESFSDLEEDISKDLAESSAWSTRGDLLETKDGTGTGMDTNVNSVVSNGRATASHKDVVFVRESSIFAISKQDVLGYIARNAGSAEYNPIHVLEQLGTKMEVSAARTARMAREQILVSCASFFGSPFLIDQDNDKVWLLCGKHAAGTVENFEVENVMASISPLLDDETSAWIEPFCSHESKESFSGQNDSQLFLEWLCSSLKGDVTKIADPRGRKRLSISRQMLRRTFSHCKAINSSVLSDLVSDKSLRKLYFDVSIGKLERKFMQTKRVKAIFQLPRAGRFHRLRDKFIQNQKKAKLFKNLRRKQRQARKNNAVERRDFRRANNWSNVTTFPKTEEVLLGAEKRQQRSLPREPPESFSSEGRTDFDSTRPLPASPNAEKRQGVVCKSMPRNKTKGVPAKELINAVEVEDGDSEAMEQSAHSSSSPEENNFDDSSLSSGEVAELDFLIECQEHGEAYDEEKLNNLELLDKWLSGKAIDKEDINRLENFRARRNKERGYRHEFQTLLDRKEEGQEVDKHRLYFLELYARQQLGDTLSADEKFYLVTEESRMPPMKPIELGPKPSRKRADPRDQRLSEDSLKHGETGEVASGRSFGEAGNLAHLENLNQPTTEYEGDDESLGSGDLFDAPMLEPTSDRPLIEAALKARAQYEREHGSCEKQQQQLRHPDSIPEGEAELSQSLGESSDPLATGTTAREETRSKEDAGKVATERSLGEATNLAHLENLNQPTTEYEDDDKSLGSGDLFDAPMMEPSSDRPLIEAALKARAQYEREHGSCEKQQQLRQPDSIPEGEEELSQSLGAISIPFATGTTAREEMGSKEDAGKVATERSLGEATNLAHLENLNQPTTEYEDDDESLGSGDLFDAPMMEPTSDRPLIEAALKARAQYEREHGSCEKQQQLRQPDSIPEGEEELSQSLGAISIPFATGTTAREEMGSKEDAGNVATERSLGEATNLAHLENLNQPTTEYEDDDESLGSGDLFDAPMMEPTSDRPLIEAALKARAQYERELGSCEKQKQQLRQPDAIPEGEEELSQSLDEKSDPLATGTMVSKETVFKEDAGEVVTERLLGEATNLAHLENLNQPTTEHEDDDKSLGSGDLFDVPPMEPTSNRPLIEAALKARAQYERERGSSEKQQEAMLQPDTIPEVEEDGLSTLGSGKLVDCPQIESTSPTSAHHPIVVMAQSIKEEESAEKSEYSDPGSNGANGLAQHTGAGMAAENGSNVIQPSDIDDSTDSSLSSGEMEELEGLFDSLENGEDYDATRLYELDLLDKAQCGQMLEEEQAIDLRKIKEKRRKERAYRREFQYLLEEKEHGRPIDEKRLYFLDLFARRHLGHTLSQKETDFILAAER